MKQRFRLALVSALMAAGTGYPSARAQGVMDELKAWEQAAPTREAEQAARRAREREALVPCKGEEALCKTQLVERGWQVISNGVELTGLDIGLTFNLLRYGNQSKICIAFFSYDGQEHERPCHEIRASLEPVKD